MTVHIDVETVGGMQRKQNRGSNDALDLLSANKAADSQVRKRADSCRGLARPWRSIEHQPRGRGQAFVFPLSASSDTRAPDADCARLPETATAVE